MQDERHTKFCNLKALYPYAGTLAASLLAALPLFLGPGIVNTRAGGDSVFLVQRVHQLTQNLREGAFPARWMPDGAYGLGYPFFDFYASLPYYVAAALNLAGFGVLGAIKLTQTLGFVAAALAMYMLVRKMGASLSGALLAVAAYTFAPFHLVNVYVRGDSLSEFYAFALYPVILWAVLKMRERPSVGHVAALAGSYALLVLCHNISAMIFSPMLGLWLVAEALSQPERGRWRALGMGVAALALGLLLSAWYWAPALREQSLVQLQDQTTGYFHYAGHFRSVDLVQPRPVYDYTLDSQHNPFSMGLLQMVLALGGLAALVWAAIRRRKVSAGQVVAAFSLLAYTWLITPLSRGVWGRVPLLPYVQFPWRMLSVQALAISILAASLPSLWRDRLVETAGLALLVVFTGMAGLSLDRLPLREADITPERLMLYETYSGNIGTTVRYEYLPKEMVPRPFVSGVQLNGGQKPPPLALEGELSAARLLRRTPSREVWEIEVSSPALLAFHTTFYPGWEATVDGAAQGVEPLAGLGLVGLRLSPGRHRVTLQLERTPVRRFTLWASAAGLLIWLAGLLYPYWRSRRYRRGAAITALCLATAVIWLLVAPRPAARPAQAKGPLVMDFARAPYLHEEPEGVYLGVTGLLGYTLSSANPRPGEELEITLHWDWTKQPHQARVELVGATAHLFAPSPVWAEATVAITTAYTMLRLGLPADMPPGLYVPQLIVLKDGQPQVVRTAHGATMGTLALAPVQVPGGRRATGEEPVLGHFGPERALPVIDLVGVETRCPGGGMIEAALAWRSQRQAPLNYMLSLRLRRADGSLVVSRDLPLLLGGYPTSLWVPGELITDRVLLALPERETPDGGYGLEIVLYDRLTLRAVGTVTTRGIACP